MCKHKNRQYSSKLSLTCRCALPKGSTEHARTRPAGINYRITATVAQQLVGEAWCVCGTRTGNAACNHGLDRTWFIRLTSSLLLPSDEIILLMALSDGVSGPSAPNSALCRLADAFRNERPPMRDWLVPSPPPLVLVLSLHTYLHTYSSGALRRQEAAAGSGRNRQRQEGMHCYT